MEFLAFFVHLHTDFYKRLETKEKPPKNSGIQILAGVADCSGQSPSSLRDRLQRPLISFATEPTHSLPRSNSRKANKKSRPNGRIFYWLGRLDSNQRMAESESAALPLGDAPTLRAILTLLR